MQKIKKAIVAVAGSGTRLLPATKAMPKEMLPIVDKPIIQLVVEELVQAGIENIIFVTRWDKKPLEDHFDHTWVLEHELEKAGKIKRLDEVRRISEMANFVYVRQKGPYGNGTPVISAANLVEDEPFMYCYGDDLVKSGISFSRQMVNEYEKTGHLMIGVQEVPASEVEQYGIMKLKKGTMKIEDIVEKPAVNEAPSRLAGFGRMILNQEIVDILKKIPLGKDNELWMTDAIQEYVRQDNEFYAKKIKDGEWLTTGDPINYIKTILKYAMDRDDIGGEINKYFEKVVCKTFK